MTAGSGRRPSPSLSKLVSAFGVACESYGEQGADGRPTARVAKSATEAEAALVSAIGDLEARVLAAEERARQAEEIVSLPGCDHRHPCTCGSGAHPRRCARHPLRFDMHVAEIAAEAAERHHVAEERDHAWGAAAGCFTLEGARSLRQRDEELRERLAGVLGCATVDNDALIGAAVDVVSNRRWLLDEHLPALKGALDEATTALRKWMPSSDAAAELCERLDGLLDRTQPPLAPAERLAAKKSPH